MTTEKIINKLNSDSKFYALIAYMPVLNERNAKRRCMQIFGGAFDPTRINWSDVVAAASNEEGNPEAE